METLLYSQNMTHVDIFDEMSHFLSLIERGKTLLDFDGHSSLNHENLLMFTLKIAYENIFTKTALLLSSLIAFIT